MPRVRIRDVADRAGVSTATVSMVLSGRGSRISESTSSTVRAAAAELGYRPDLNARGLRTQRTQLIGLVSDYIATTPHAVQIVAGAQEACWARDHLVLVANTEDNAEHESGMLEALMGRRVDGYLYGAMFHRSGRTPSALDPFPVVGVDIELEGRACFVPDDYQGGRDAASLVVSAGHRRVGLLHGKSVADAAAMRAQAFVDVTSAASCFDAGLIRRAEDHPELSDTDFGEFAALDLLSRPDRPTALVAFNDAMALGIYRAAAQLGLRIPRDLSVVGYDDYHMIANELRPRLTTVRLPHREMGRIAAEELLRQLDEPDEPVIPQIRRLACPVIQRESVAPPA